ncbi:MgtC/SapB family protein [Candidatus Peribacteria bacterium]|nr:MgtC/SapB family protein [Candidatus Peribacteria bacterium]
MTLPFLAIQDAFPLALAIGLGGFFGLQRDIRQLHRTQRYMGVRTMGLMSLMGYLSFQLGEAWAMLTFGVLGLLLITSHILKAMKIADLGITGVIAALLLFLVGMLCAQGSLLIAFLATMLLSLLDGYRKEVYHFADTLTITEWQSALHLLLLSGVLLPFLPIEPLDPWGVVSLRSLWLLVLFILGIDFIGYFLAKYIGNSKSIFMVSLLGAMVSSTAVTTSLSLQSQLAPVGTERLFAGGILLGTMVMQLRVMAEILVLAPEAQKLSLALIPLCMAVGSALAVLWITYGKHNTSPPIDEESLTPTVSVQSPFRILPALLFGGIFAGILLALYFAQRFFGEQGVYATAFLSGMVDIDAIVLSALEQLRNGIMSPHIASSSVLIALAVNTGIKVVYTFLLGHRRTALWVLSGIGMSLVAGGIGYGLFML